jgi:hypothetical protein
MLDESQRQVEALAVAGVAVVGDSHGIFPFRSWSKNALQWEKYPKFEYRWKGRRG